MSRWFGSGGKAKASSSSSADVDVLAQIRDSKELIEKREEHLTRKIKQETAEAIRHKEAGRKDQALACLKRKKLMDEELNGLVQQRLKLDAQEHTIQSLKFNEHTLAVERAATAAIKRHVDKIGGVEKLEEQREQTQETLEDAYEMLNVASQPLANPALGGATDEDLLAQLEELEEEEERRKLAARLTEVHLGEEAGSNSSTAAAKFPTAPTNAVASTLAEEEARELAELEMLAASMRAEPMAMPMSAMSMGLALGQAVSVA